MSPSEETQSKSIALLEAAETLMTMKQTSSVPNSIQHLSSVRSPLTEKTQIIENTELN